ncbi:hypothetical protein EV560_101739 [Bosea sp. BK604]|nr:hypothetical protein EV560_101739 [Bosea sp. BK604]
MDLAKRASMTLAQHCFPLANSLMRAYTRIHVQSLHLHDLALGLAPHGRLL